MPSLAQLSSRQREILDLANDRGFVSVEDLASMFTVTTQTVRRDLNELCDIGFLKRFHGGAGLPTSAENISYDNRTKMALDYKRRIASQVADNIPDGASVFIDVGTTTEEIAKMLAQKQRLRVITNSLNVAQILAHKSDFEVIMSCGVVRESDRAVLGEVAVNFFRQFRLDYGILGTSGIDDDGTLLDFDLRKVEVTKAIIERSRHIFLAADSTKFNRNAMVRAGHLEQISSLFTNEPLPPSIAEVARAHGINVVVCNR